MAGWQLRPYAHLLVLILWKVWGDLGLNEVTQFASAICRLSKIQVGCSPCPKENSSRFGHRNDNESSRKRGQIGGKHGSGSNSVQDLTCANFSFVRLSICLHRCVPPHQQVCLVGKMSVRKVPMS